MNTNCNQARRSLSAWLDCPEKERQRVLEHTRACAECEAEYEQILRLVNQLEASRESYLALRYAGTRPDFPARQGLRGWRLWRPLPVALASALVFSLAIYLARSLPPPASPPEPVRKATAETNARPPAESSRVRSASASASLAAIRQRARQIGRPATPKKPSGLGFRPPPRPKPPKRPGNG